MAGQPISHLHHAANFAHKVSQVTDRRHWHLGLRWVAPLLALVLLLVWQVTVPASGPTTLLLPRPSAIGQRFIEVTRDGTLIGDALTTAIEIALGFGFGVGTAFVLGYSIAHSRTLEQ